MDNAQNEKESSQHESLSQGNNVAAEAIAASDHTSVMHQVKGEQIESLKKCVERTLASYRRKRTWNKLGAIAVHIVTIGFSSVTTILLGWAIAKPTADSLKNYALLFSALATAAGSLEAVFDFRALWVGYNVSISRLKAVSARLNYLEAGGGDRLTWPNMEELYKRYETICVAMEKDYKDTRTTDDA